MVKLWSLTKSGLKNHNRFFMVSGKIQPKEPWWLSMCLAKSIPKNNDTNLPSTHLKEGHPIWITNLPSTHLKEGHPIWITNLPSTHLKEGHLLIRSSSYNRYVKTYVNERSSPSMTYTHQLNDASAPPYQLNDITHPCDKCTNITLKIHITRSHDIKSWSIF